MDTRKPGLLVQGPLQRYHRGVSMPVPVVCCCSLRDHHGGVGAAHSAVAEQSSLVLFIASDIQHPLETGGRVVVGDRSVRVLQKSQTAASKSVSLLVSLHRHRLPFTMRLELEDWHVAYNQILSDCRQGNGTALLLAHADVDSLAAARILAYMLRQDSVVYQLLPCTSFSRLEAILENQSSDLRAVVLFNMGATRNLTRLFADGSMLEAKIYVMDARRPVHLANVHAGENVCVFWDEVQNDDIPSDGDNLSGNELDSSDDEDEDSSDDEESDDEGEHEFDDDEGEAEMDDGVPSFDDKENQEQDTEYDGEDESEGSRSKRHKKDSLECPEPEEEATEVEPAEDVLPTLTPRQLYEARQNRLRAYYSTGTFHGSPASYVAYRIATQLRFGEISELLWWGCIGVTDAYLHSRLDLSGYMSLAMDLNNACRRLFPNDLHTRVGNTIYAEHLAGAANNQALTKVGFSENGRVLCESDFRFFLLRHSSLFDAMVYSDFVSTRFQLSTNQGMHKLKELLATMGYPLNECQQPFAFMKPSLRRRLREQIREHAEEFGLENFEFTSFFRVTGFQSLLSASDVSYAVTALLECEASNAAIVEEDADPEEQELIQAFSVAFDALSSENAPSSSLAGLSSEGHSISNLVNGGKLTGTTGISHGLRLAITLQRSIMSTAANLMARNAIIRLSHFRYAYVTCTSQAENPGEELVPTGQSTEEEKYHVFAKPLALTRLAHYLMDFHRENGKWTGARARPLILMAEKPRTKTYLVAGYEYPEIAGTFVKNTFGKHFELAAQSMQGTFRFDSFDSHIVEVAATDVQRFIEQLHYLMDSL